MTRMEILSHIPLATTDADVDHQRSWEVSGRLGRTEDARIGSRFCLIYLTGEQCMQFMKQNIFKRLIYGHIATIHQKREFEFDRAQHITVAPAARQGPPLVCHMPKSNRAPLPGASVFQSCNNTFWLPTSE